MQRSFRYKEEDLLAGWLIEVRKGPPHIGNIRKNPMTGAFQCYSGPNNQLNSSFEDDNLDSLKKRIETPAKKCASLPGEKYGQVKVADPGTTNH